MRKVQNFREEKSKVGQVLGQFLPSVKVGQVSGENQIMNEAPSRTGLDLVHAFDESWTGLG